MKNYYIIFALIFALVSCTKDPADTVIPITDPVDTVDPNTDPVDTIDPNTDPVDTVDPNTNPADTFETFTFHGIWRYEDYKIENGIIQIDTSYPGELDVNISNDSIKIKAGTAFEEYLAKTSLINDSLVYMRKKCTTCKSNSLIKLTPDEKSVTYVYMGYSPLGGPPKYTFVGERN